MYLKSIVIFSLVSAFVPLTLALLGQSNSVVSIVLRSRKDNTYLTAVNNAIPCKTRGSVITTHSHKQADSAQKWDPYVFAHKNEGHLFLVGAFNNEVMFQNKTYCQPLLASYKLIDAAKNNDFRLKNVENQKCLTAKGEGKRISWEKCRSISSNYTSQYWYARLWS